MDRTSGARPSAKPARRASTREGCSAPPLWLAFLITVCLVTPDPASASLPLEHVAPRVGLAPLSRAAPSGAALPTGALFRARQPRMLAVLAPDAARPAALQRHAADAGRRAPPAPASTSGHERLTHSWLGGLGALLVSLTALGSWLRVCRRDGRPASQRRPAPPRVG